MAQKVRKDTPSKYYFAILRIGEPPEKCGQKVMGLMCSLGCVAAQLPS